ncbi:SAM-dependent methyltransferase [Mycolicibacter minnesotensis]|uniref:S-adenosyl-L-methionine-dependent methyltransferase n=1 Tax=Mycolicibacter minnesotensis TaxID=1118379 RepID=A0A7I7R474_9MYCO|nr:class I SAM-dependent methyltransferase [Mycolicibacter minnesotensis]ORA99768.1 SAM-dependent methyltransferase [Mycolicibacter minnesotensis]BBY32950.1 putative S-adenosyl-L-methionine-dependent methyltransferase [Mycolicibacter minnesotensis]
MARTDNDSWDLASSVGITATGVAVGRAIASRAERPLINDPFAEPLVRAVGLDLFSRLASGELAPEDLGDEGPMNMARMADNMAVRTRFFDDFFTESTAAGIHQVVILASGLDSRAYRLNWPAGTVVYEVDQPEVIAFKTRVLAQQGAEPTADRRTVAVDLRQDWPAALRAAGFHAAQPTAWSAEGLLAYLPPDAQDRLLDTVTALSAPGSRMATESTPGLDTDSQAQARLRMQESAERMRRHGVDIDMAELLYFGDRNEAGRYLAGHNWRVDSHDVVELFAEYGVPPLADDADSVFGRLAYISAVRG